MRQLSILLICSHSHVKATQTSTAPAFSPMRQADVVFLLHLKIESSIIQSRVCISPSNQGHNKKMREGIDQRISKRKYSKISLQKRVKLVRLVTEGGQAVTKAAKKLSIKLCTARIILKKYKQTGSFPMKTNRPRTTLRTNAESAPQPPSPTLPTPTTHDNPCPPQNTSFSSPCGLVKEEAAFYPFWLSWEAYYSLLAAQMAQ